MTLLGNVLLYLFIRVSKSHETITLNMYNVAHYGSCPDEQVLVVDY